MNTERLLDAARRLRLVPDEKFDLGVFTISGLLNTVVKRPEDLETCGSAACLLGWLPAWYPEDWTYAWGRPQLRVGRKNALSFEHGASWFGISRANMSRLASPIHYSELQGRPTPSQVAKRIERMVANYNAKMKAKNEHGTTT